VNDQRGRAGTEKVFRVRRERGVIGRNIAAALAVSGSAELLRIPEQREITVKEI